MTGALLLSFWRERWRKPDGMALQKPYKLGTLIEWTQKLQTADLWQRPYQRAVFFLFVLQFAFIGIGVGLKDTAQLMVATAMFVVAIFVRRFGSPVFFVMLAYFSFLASLRYLAWRLQYTLPVEGWPLVLGLCLWSVEMFVCLTCWLRMSQWLKPLRQKPGLLPEDTLLWPSVDAVVVVQDEPLSQVQRCIHALQAQQWPAGKLHVALLCQRHRDEIAALAREFELPVEVQAEPMNWLADGKNLVLLQSDLRFVLHQAPALPPQWMRNSTSWMVEDPSLGRLWTPDPQGLAQPLWSHDVPKLSLELSRRQALQELVELRGIGAIPNDPLLWRATGFQSSWIIPTPDASACMRVNPPGSSLALGLQLLREWLLQALLFYAPLLRWMFALIPALALGLAWQPLGGDSTGWLIYGVPHALLAGLAMQTERGPGRLTLGRLLREWLVQGIVTLRTVHSFVMTCFERGWADPALRARVWMPEMLIIAMQLAGVGGWVWSVTGDERFADGYWSVLLAWSLLNICLALVRLAIAKERALVKQASMQRVHQDALLTLAPGRLVRAKTINFPDYALRLQWDTRPAQIPVVGDWIHLSIFFRDHECSVAAQVQSTQDTGLSLIVASQYASEYAAYGAAVFSREAHWPQWLAPRDADQLLPNWMHRIYDAVETFFYDFIITRTGIAKVLGRFSFARRPEPSQHG